MKSNQTLFNFSSTRPQPTAEQVAWARAYWTGLTEKDLHFYHKHYTTGAGAGMFHSVFPDSTFEEYLYESAQQSAFEHAHDL